MPKKRHKKAAQKKYHGSPQTLLKRINKLHFPKVQNLAGFAVETAQPGELTKIQTRGSLISDMPLFYTYIDQISGIFLNSVLVGQVVQFLVIIHEDLSADVYLNDFPVNILMMAKRSLEKGQAVRTNDIADIRQLRFAEINIKGSDKVIYCFKVCQYSSEGP